MFVTNWISTTKIQKISEITNFFRHYFLSRTEVICGKTIRHTVESVLRQTYPDYEYIVVDGGSIDNSIDVVKEYQVAFKGRLKWISEQDKGIYDAMNKGIRIATGDVVGILNSDDFYTDENVLQTVADNFVNHSVDAVYGDIHFVREGNLDKCVRYYSSRLFSPFWLRFGFMPAPSFLLLQT